MSPKSKVLNVAYYVPVFCWLMYTKLRTNTSYKLRSKIV